MMAASPSPSPSRLSTLVAKVLLLVVVVAAATAITVKCNETLVLAVTGGVTTGDDGVTAKKTWGQVGDVVNDEWDDQHRVQDIGDYISRIAKKAKSKACQISNGGEKCRPETDDKATNEAPTTVEKAYDDVSDKASKNLHKAEKKVHVLKYSNTLNDDEL